MINPFTKCPPTKEQRGREFALQKAEEDEAAARNALSFLYRKVQTHSQQQNSIVKRDETLHRIRSASAHRASSVRKERKELQENRKQECEELAESNKKKKQIVKRDPAVADDILDMRFKFPPNKKQPKAKSDEKLQAWAKDWVMNGRGGYFVSDLNSGRDIRAMNKAETERKKEIDSFELKMKKQRVKMMKQKEKVIMKEKAGLSAKYHLPSLSSDNKKKGEGESEEKENEKDEDEEEEEEDLDEEEKTKRQRAKFAMMNGVSPSCILPQFHVTEKKQMRREVKREKQVVEAKMKVAEKKTEHDIDVAAKLLILHAHLLRKACVESSVKKKSEEGGEEATSS